MTLHFNLRPNKNFQKKEQEKAEAGFWNLSKAGKWRTIIFHSWVFSTTFSLILLLHAYFSWFKIQDPFPKITLSFEYEEDYFLFSNESHAPRTRRRVRYSPYSRSSFSLKTRKVSPGKIWAMNNFKNKKLRPPLVNWFLKVCPLFSLWFTKLSKSKRNFPVENPVVTPPLSSLSFILLQ